MITPQEIDAKASEFDLTVPNVQRDYVFGWLIFGIYTISELKDQLILKGGNALRKAYFEHTRFSDDLDFTTEGGLDGDFLLNELNKVCQFIQETAGVQFDFERNQISDERIINNNKKVFKIKLYFKDFYQGLDHITISIRMDVTEFDKLYLPIQTRKIIHPYSDSKQLVTEIRCIKLEEALADKMKCLLQRSYSFDLYDLVYAVFINNEIEVNKTEIVQTLLKKTIFEPSPLVVKNLLLDLPLEFFRVYWQKHIVCPIQGRVDFDQAVEKFKNGLEILFETFSYGQHQSLAYFGSSLRNPILKAGREMTLLKVNYDGISRLVEPYSVIYKRRQDGVAQEYFYGYDRTGGHSGPGIKAFVNTKCASIENTEDKFDPQWEVELSKAGELIGSSYFSKPFSSGQGRTFSTPKTRSPRRKSYYGVTYTIQCSYCSKRFKRNTYSTRLNEHKDKYGNRCFGRIGYMV